MQLLLSKVQFLTPNQGLQKLKISNTKPSNAKQVQFLYTNPSTTKNAISSIKCPISSTKPSTAKHVQFLAANQVQQKSPISCIKPSTAKNSISMIQQKT